MFNLLKALKAQTLGLEDAVAKDIIESIETIEFTQEGWRKLKYYKMKEIA